MPRVDCSRVTPIVRTPRVRQLEGIFDVPPAERSEVRWQAEIPIEARDWRIGLIVGHSGSGKTTIARELFGNALVGGFDWPADQSILDAFPEGLGIKDITGLLSSVGFSSPPAWLRPFRALSNGEQFRVTMARALAEQPDLVVIDEFTSVVDRTVARIGSAAIAKTVRRRKSGRFVAVSCHHDVIDWLQPDWIFEPDSNRFQWRSLQRRPPIALEIRRVHRSAWQLFKHHHYLSGDLNRNSYCFVGSVEGRPACFTAVINFPHAVAPCYREHRTVCLPDFQGVGIGNAMSEFIASVFASTGRAYRSVTSHPAMIRHRMSSPRWRMDRKPSLAGGYKHSGLSQAKGETVRAAGDRITASFVFVGRPAAADVARPLLDAMDSEFLELVERFPNASIQLLARKAGFSEVAAGRSLHRLIAAGQVQRQGRGVTPDVYTYVRIRR